MSGEPNVNFYEFDGCYSKPTSSSSFDISLNSRFYNSIVESVAQCQAEAMQKNADFFLMNDISSATVNALKELHKIEINQEMLAQMMD